MLIAALIASPFIFQLMSRRRAEPIQELIEKEKETA
jgi:hypothetical protein